MARKFRTTSDFIEGTRVRKAIYTTEQAKDYAKRNNIKWFDTYKDFTKNYTGENEVLERLWNKEIKKQQLLLSGQFQSFKDTQYKEAFKDYLEKSKDSYDLETQDVIEHLVKALDKMSGEEFSRRFNEEMVNIEAGKYGEKVKSKDFELKSLYTNHGVAYAVNTDIRSTFLTVLNNITSGNPDREYKPEYNASHRGKELLEDFREDYLITPTAEKQLRRIGAKNIDKYTEDSLNPYDIIARYARDKISQGKRWKYGLSQEEVNIVNEILASE